MATSLSPTITVAELEQKATAFASDLMGRLAELNNKFSVPELEPPWNDAIPEPFPRNFELRFKRVFYEYIASRQVIVP
jgi:hypothetical protein